MPTNIDNFIQKICLALDVTPDEIMEIIPDEPKSEEKTTES